MFRRMKLSEIGQIVAGGTPKTKIEEYWNGDVSWITPKDLSSHAGMYISKGERNISQKGLDNSSAKLLPKGTVLFTSRAPIGYVAIARNEVTTNQGFKSIIVDDENDNIFVYYLLKNNISLIENHANGSTFKEISGAVMKNLEFDIPSLMEQKSIAHILSTLDDKIEVNNKINKTLENMAHEIFKQWFVDFEFPNEDGEPYNSSGGEMVESKLGLIPKGWEVSTLKDVINIIDNRGKTPPQEPNKTIYPIIDVKALSGDIRVIDYNNCMKYVSKETYDNWFRSGHPSQGDILLSTVGSLAELKIFMGNTGCIAQNVVALRAINISNLYLFELLKNIKNDLVSYNIGSVQPSIKVTHIVKHKILIPNNIIVEKFHHFIDRITNKIFVKHNENVLLTSMRDSLIPKLMSGEIRVPCLLDGAGKPCDEEGAAS
ncbi:restriction endonuclease subunit S [Mesobacillus subterraneus]|uniref:restriction endonuclease subunit S n=1 Tax=Mesobacillus subterraneus TaxID=285983 RepID=UPI00069C03A2|nr:restriction endonuclease subunit S [Mesobacillus subterraneus]